MVQKCFIFYQERKDIPHHNSDKSYGTVFITGCIFKKKDSWRFMHFAQYPPISGNLNLRVLHSSKYIKVISLVLARKRVFRNI